MRIQVWSLALLSVLRILCFRELQHRPAAAAPIQPLAWELPYAALKRKKKKKKESSIIFSALYLSFLKLKVSGFLWWCSRLRIQHRLCSDLDLCCCGPGSIPGWGTSTCHRRSSQKKKKINGFYFIWVYRAHFFVCFHSQDPSKTEKKYKKG